MRPRSIYSCLEFSSTYSFRSFRESQPVICFWRRQIDEKSQEAASLQSDLGSTTTKLNDANTQLAAEKTKIVALEAKISELASSATAGNDAVEELKRQLSESKQNLAEKQSKLDEKDSKIFSLETEQIPQLKYALFFKGFDASRVGILFFDINGHLGRCRAEKNDLLMELDSARYAITARSFLNMSIQELTFWSLCSGNAVCGCQSCRACLPIVKPNSKIWTESLLKRTLR